MQTLISVLMDQGESQNVMRTVCGIIIFITVAGMLFRLISSIKSRPVGPLTSLAPSAAISFGIFGTFLGIFLGLRGFDTADINNSIPSLLEGLKIAFITSIFGMAASLLLKYWYGSFDKKDLKKETAASEDPIVLLRQISTGVTSLSSDINSIGTTLLRCFQSEEEFSFISQLKIIRTDMNDLKREVIKSLGEFGEKVAELGTEAMIEALRDVIEQFNTHLNDMVGEEFKQLKEAMLKLVEWQENHRIAVDEMQTRLSDYLAQVRKSTELLERTSIAISNSSTHLDSIDGSLSTLSIGAEDIEQHIAQLKIQNQQLKEFISSIKDMGEEAKTVLPSISKHIEASTTDLVNASKLASDLLNQAGKNFNSTVETVAGKMEEFTKLHAEQTNTSIEKIERNMETVLNKSLTGLGGQLAALSNKFVNDYGPLTDRLRKVVSIAKGVENAAR